MAKSEPEYHSPWHQAPAQPAQRSRVRFFRRYLVLVAIVALLFLGISYLVPPAGVSSTERPYLLRGSLLVFIVLAAIAGSRRSFARIGAELGVWLALMVGMVVLYAYRFELQAVASRTFSELIPSQPAVTSDDSVVLRRSLDGQFHVDAQVDEVPVRFLIDTGASGIVLTSADAARIGIDRSQLRFTQLFETANGVIRGAAVRLHTLRIGPLLFSDIAASVGEGDLSECLLGMHLLEKLSSVEIRNGSLILRR